MRLYGLIGYPLSHTFSPSYFAEKFRREGITDAAYRAFPLTDIQEFGALLAEHPDFCGLNVTIPYKAAVMRYLDDISDEAQHIGAVNTIAFEGGKTVGYNTDVIGFEQSLLPFLGHLRPDALVLGSGGAAKAVCFALRRLGISYRVVSRTQGGDLQYADLSAEVLHHHPLIINTTPVGMYPHIAESPLPAANGIGEGHFLYDLVYNPAETAFMQQGLACGAKVCNGLAMLHGQAEAAWQIWNRPI